MIRKALAFALALGLAGSTAADGAINASGLVHVAAFAPAVTFKDWTSPSLA